MKQNQGFNGDLNPEQNHKTRNSPNGYVATAVGVQETELNARNKHCLAKREKEVKVKNSQQHWALRVMVKVCMKVRLPIGVGVHETEVNADITLFSQVEK